MDETPNQTEKIFPRDEMYPRYNFLKRRLHSIFPRFKATIEKGELAELIPNGKKRMTQITEAREKLKDTISVYVTGNHNALTTQIMEKNFIVSSKGTEEYGLVARPLQDQEFKESIRNIAEKPSVIVHIENIEDGDTFERLKGATRSLVRLLPPRDRNSCVLCTETCQEYCSLEDFNINNVLSDLDSLGKLIQSCLEAKVVKVLQLMAEFIEDFLPGEAAEDLAHCDQVRAESEPLLIAVKQSLQKSVCEPALRKELSEQEKRKSCEESMVWYLCRSMENQICQSLSVRYRIKPVVVLQSLYKMDLDKTIKEHVEKYPDFFKKNDLERGLICDELTQSLSADLTDFEEKAKEKFLIIPKVLTKIGFEIYGVFRQAKLPISNNLQTRMVVPSIPRNLQNKILSLEGIYGCGFIYGKLVVHVKEDTQEMVIDMREITDKVKVIIRQLGFCNYINNFEIKRVHNSSAAGVTYESGKSLRTKRTLEEVNVSDVLIDGNHSYGTLGCFIKGKGNGTGPDYTTEMYALSCAHVFPPDCDNCVEISRADVKYDHFGTVSPQLTLHKGNIIDIAAILVDATVVEKCNVHLKNCDAFEGWGSILHEGSFDDLIGIEVYKWGSISDLTHGVIISYDYKVQRVESFDDDFNIFIETLPNTDGMNTDFSSKGDSGTVVCFEDPVEEKVVALSMINGALYDRLEDNKFICSYSCHLHRNIEELSKDTNITFEWISDVP